jgi:hypothetical protein
MEKTKLIIKTLVAGVMGLPKGSWLYYAPKKDVYEFSYTKEDNQSDIGSYYSYKAVSATIDNATVESYLGELFEYVVDPVIIDRLSTDDEKEKNE